MKSSCVLSFPQSNERLQKILWDPDTQIERKNKVKYTTGGVSMFFYTEYTLTHCRIIVHKEKYWSITDNAGALT
jgi:hypothetical protein